MYSLTDLAGCGTLCAFGAAFVASALTGLYVNAVWEKDAISHGYATYHTKHDGHTVFCWRNDRYLHDKKDNKDDDDKVCAKDSGRSEP